MLVAAAVCPHPPVLIPQAMGMAGADGGQCDRPADARIRELRAACHAAVGTLAGARPDLIVVVGGASQTSGYPGSAAGSLADFGVPFTTGQGPPVLPLSLTVGAWLIREQPGIRPPWWLALQAIAWSAPPPDCHRLGAELAARADRVALLVMGDGSARRVLGPPGCPDPDAQAYDRVVATALAAADARCLAAIDAELAAEYLVGGRGAWQVMAGAVLGAKPPPDEPPAVAALPDEPLPDEPLRAAAPEHGAPMPSPALRLAGHLSYAAAPLDVMYFVASWASRLPGALP